MSSHTPGVGVSTEQCQQMTQGEGRVQNWPKKCHVLFEWPLSSDTVSKIASVMNLSQFDQQVLLISR
jgi:hypothetical protein